MTRPAIHAPGTISGVVSGVQRSAAGVLAMLSGQQKLGDVVFEAPIWLPNWLVERERIENEQILCVSGALRFAAHDSFAQGKRLVLEAQKLTVKNVGVQKIIGSRKTHTAKASGVYLEDATNNCVVSGVQVEDLSSDQLPGIGRLVLLQMLDLGGVVHVREPMPLELKNVPLLATVTIEGSLTSEACPDGQFPLSFLISSRIELLRLGRELPEANTIEYLGSV